MLKKQSLPVKQKKDIKMKNKALNFKAAFKYPFNRPKGLLNFLWILVPIFGWFALGGYVIEIVTAFTKGKFKKTPKMKFWPNCKLGFLMFLKSIPFMFVYGIISSIIDGSLAAFFVSVPIWYLVGNIINFFIMLFVVPILTINFFKKRTVGSFFELSKVKYVFQNMEDYIIALLKSIGLGIIFLVMIVILVGLPAGQFTKNIFLADFYWRNVKK